MSKTNWQHKLINNLLKLATRNGGLSKEVEQKLVKSVANNTIFNEYYERSATDGGYERQAVAYREKEIKDWIMAVAGATDPDNPSRSALYRVYESLFLDDHLQTTFDNRALALQQASCIIVDKNGKEDEAATMLLERPWMQDLKKLYVKCLLQGPTLVRMSELLTDNMELKEVEEYPQCNFIAPKGIILNRDGDTTGLSYKEGALANYFVQFGNDWALGMLNELAIIIMAKKLGLGSWLSYIEKYGIPPIFAITNRMDVKRRDELFDMLSMFSSNHFGVLQGDEKIEIGKEMASSGSNAFNPLLQRGDMQISRRILGQTGTTTEEAYVGTAQVHERVEEKRHNADKMMFGYYFNTEILPRLVKLSPVYRVLEGKTLQWDNAEKMNVATYIDAITKLSGLFDFDPEEIKAKTGLPILAAKQVAVPDTPAATVKKKVDGVSALTASAFGNIFERVMQSVYDNGVEAGSIDIDLFNETYKELRKAAADGWGDSFTDADAANRTTAQTIRENLYLFSGAKTYQQLRELSGLLVNEKGEKRPFTEFRSEALKVNENYNENWLSAENDTAVGSAQMAEKWGGYEQTKNLFPNLKYVAVNDQNTRPEHAALDGTIKPVDDSFWNINYPPNGFRCRCHVEPTAEPETSGTPQIDIDYRFANNVGKTGEVFVEKHPYFSIPAKDLTKVNNSIELQKAFAPYSHDKKSTVMISDFADSKRLPVLLDNARKLSAELDLSVRIKPLIKAKDVLQQDYDISKKPGLQRNIDKPNNVRNAVTDAIDNECNYVVLNLNEEIDKAKLHKAIKSIESNEQTDGLTLVFIKGQNVVKTAFKQYKETDLDKL